MQHTMTPPRKTQHLRQVSGRGLVTASLMGAFLSFLCGAWIAPWVWAVILWGVHRIPWWSQPGSFPSLGDFFTHLSLLFGFIWLGYYTLAYLRAFLTRSPRQRVALSTRFALQQEEQDGDWGFHYPSWHSDDLFRASGPKPHQHPISQAWPGELKYQLVEQCYDAFRRALQRYDPPPLHLHTPPTFRYQKSAQLKWDATDGIPILPEEYLTPLRIGELMPWLAHHLGYAHLEGLSFKDLEPDPVFVPGSPDYVPFAPLLIPTGNFLWLPVLVKRGQEQAKRARSEQDRKDRGHKADAFAVLLGQGPALEHLLRRMEEDLKLRGERDPSVPTLVERLGHLEVLNGKERDEMRQLGLKPKEPPLVVDPPPPQLKPGKGNPWDKPSQP